MKLKSFLFFVFSFTSVFKLFANTDSVRIEVKIPQINKQQVFLCSYFNGGVYKQDSLYLSMQGEGVFHKKEKYPEGLYLIYLNGRQFADFLLGDDQTLSVTLADTANIARHTRIAGAEQSKVFQTLADYLYSKQMIREQILSRFRSLADEEKEKSKAVVQEQLDSLDKEVSKFQSEQLFSYKNKWAGAFFQGLRPVETGPHPIPKTQEEYDEEFKYQKEHYFDNINLKDKRFWWSNYFPQKVVSYLENQVEQVPDSMANVASRLVAKTMDGDSLAFQLMLNKLIDYSATSKFMGMENIWMKLIEDYYHKGLVTWADSAHLSNIDFEYNKLRYNRIGMQAQDLNLQDSLGKPVTLYNVGKKYTLLYFYEPSCGHCIKSTPEIYEKIYKKYADKGLDVAAVCIISDKKEWLDFIEKNQLKGEHWHNLWDPTRKSLFWQFYDTSSTPGIYVLDENKKIVAKKIEADMMDTLFNDYLIENKAP